MNAKLFQDSQASSYVAMPSIKACACPLSLCPGLSFSSRLIVLVEVSRVVAMVEDDDDDEEEEEEEEVGCRGTQAC